MIKLHFLQGRGLKTEVFRIYIDKETVWYSDRIWKQAVRWIPRDERFKDDQMFELTEDERKEYEQNKHSEESLAKVILNDCIKKGAKLMRKEVI